MIDCGCGGKCPDCELATAVQRAEKAEAEAGHLRAAMTEAMIALEPDDAEATAGWAILEHALRDTTSAKQGGGNG